jgi:hypothetical protein
MQKVFATVLIVFPVYLFAQTESIDSQVQKLFSALKSKDTAAYLKLFASGRQMDQVYGLGLERLSPKERADLKKSLKEHDLYKSLNVDSLFQSMLHQYSAPSATEKLRAEAAHKFNSVVIEGEKKGVIWLSATLNSYHLDTFEINKNQIQTTGVKLLNGVIDFSSGDSSYELRFYNLTYLPLDNGWFGGEFIELIRKGESFTPDIEVVEIATQTIQEVPPPPPPPPAKQKVKTPSVKTKTKTKTKS